MTDTDHAKVKRKLLLRTNLALCALLAVGFTAVSALNYSSNIKTFWKSVEHVSSLTSESISHQINSYFTRPVSVSMTMANDSLLKHLLAEEMDRLDDETYVARLQEYLNAYREQYGYLSVFLVSTRTNRYYRFSGLDRELSPDDPDTRWYYSFLNSPEAYELNVDNDYSQDAGRALAAFVNYKIYGDDGGVMGVVGVGLQIGDLQRLLRGYKDQYGVRAMLIDDTGTAAISSEHEGGDWTADLCDDFEYFNDANLESIVRESGAGRETFWIKRRDGGDCFVAARHVPAMQWSLIVESDASGIETRFKRQFFLGTGITAFIALLALLVVNKVVLAYNGRLLKLIVAQELEYHSLIKSATKEMYADVYEFDITRGRAVGEDTRQYLEKLGLGAEADFQEAMKAIAEQQVKEEFRPEFMAVATRDNVLKIFHSGVREIKFEVMMNTHWKDYHWVRVRARLFFWNADQSVHMIIYNQDIHKERELEQRLLNDSQTDPLTGLYNRRFTEKRLDRLIRSMSRLGGTLSILLLDVDFFKKYNDAYGHSQGDECLRQPARH